MTLLWIFVLPLCAVTAAADWQSFPLRENGTIPVWTVAGPFPNGNPLVHGPGCFGYYRDYLATVGGEAGCMPAEGDAVPCDANKRLTWKTAFSDASGIVDYIDTLGVDKETPGVAYAFCQLYAPRPEKVLLKIRSNDGVRVWLNREMVDDHHVGRGLDGGAEDRVIANLRAGNNRLLVKVDQGAGAWGHWLAVAELDGAPKKGLAARVDAVAPLNGKIRSATISASSLVSRGSQGERQMVMAQILSGGLKDVVCRISMPEWSEPQVFSLGDLPLGKHRVELHVPVLSEGGPAQVVLESSTDRLELHDVHLPPPRHWTVYLVQHTHTDIGYTRPQDELLPAFLRYIDYALDYCDLTDDYPEDARFRWTCEAAWAVREYLRRRPPEQIERLRQRVAEGRIEITALFLNLDELADESVMAASLQPIRAFRKHGLSVRTAMQNDVPGVAWCLVDYFSDSGVKYLSMGINNDRTPRPFKRPTAFWWESPSGKRLLAWRPDHYHTGNHLRIHGGQLNPFQHGLLDYLQSLHEKGYPFDRIAVQYSGIQIDNSPPSPAECDLIRQWNEKYAWPRLRSATAREFFEYVEQQHADELPSFRGAWPNWWTDGFAFAAVETAEARTAHVGLSVAEGMLSIAALLGAEIPRSICARIAEIQDDLLFYDEHTFGAQEEFSHPMAKNAIVQWGEKVSHVWEAVKNCAMLRDTAWGLLQSHLYQAEVPTIAVVNTLNWPRSGRVEVYIGHELLPLDRVFRLVDAVTGESVPVRLARSRFEGSYWTLWVSDVPPMGYKTIRIEVGRQRADPAPAPASKSNLLENRFYRLVVDAESGAITSLFDKEWNRELVARDSPWGLGAFIRDRLVDSHFYDRASYNQRSTRTSLRNVRIEQPGDSSIWRTIRISADADGCIASAEKPGVRCDVRLYETEKRIELHFEIRKRFVTEPEAIYIAFPFGLRDGQIVYEAQGGLVTPGVTQLPGSSADWHTVQNFVSVRDHHGQIIVGSDRVPLAQFGEINLGKWQYVARVKKPHVFSWVTNDYWSYNFRGSKESEFAWSYYLTSAKDTSNTRATRFGWGSRTPLVARVFTPAKRTSRSPSRATLKLDPANVLIVNARPATDGKGIIVHLREVEGKRADVELDCPGHRMSRIDTVNVLEETIETDVSKLRLDPFEVKFLRLLL